MAILAGAFGGIARLRGDNCLDAMVVNSSSSTLKDVRVTYLGSTRSLGDLEPWECHGFGLHAFGWTPVAISYTDGRGRRVGATQRIGVDLRRPIPSGGDCGQAVINITPTAISGERWYWVNW